MVKLPTFEELGQVNVANTRAPATSHDFFPTWQAADRITSAASRSGLGMVALGRGIGDLGAGIAAGLRARQGENDRLQSTLAQSSWASSKANLDDEVANVIDPVKLRNEYPAKYQAALDLAASNLNDRQKKFFLAGHSPELTKSVLGVGAKVNFLEGQQQLANTYTSLENLRNSQLKTDDPEEHARAIDVAGQGYDDLARKGLISPLDAAQRKDKWVRDFATAWLDAKPPDEQLRYLRATLERDAEAPPVTGDISAINKYVHKGEPLQQITGMIIHHTGGRGTPESVINTFNQRGLSSQYIMDREGRVWNALPEGTRGAHILPAGNRSGLSNSNTLGLEIIAKDASDVTPQQARAAAAFALAKAKQYGFSPSHIFGHGEVNPGHKQADEGLAAARLARAGIGNIGYGRSASQLPSSGDPAMVAKIRAGASAAGADPNVMEGIYHGEGAVGYVGDSGSSFGPFQLHMGGLAGGELAAPGLGDDFKRETGLDPRDPNTVDQQISWVAKKLKSDPNLISNFHGYRGAAPAKSIDTRLPSLIPYDKRVEMARKAEAGMARLTHAQTVAANNEKAEVNKLLADDNSSIMTTGQEIPQISPERVEASLGLEQRVRFEQDRIDAHDYYAQMNGIEQVPGDQMQARVDALAPLPGTAGFASRARYQEIAQKQVDALLKARLNDPAAAAGAFPTVREAAKNASLDRPWSYTPLVRARMAAQEQLGIPEDFRQPITNAEAQQFRDRFAQAAPQDKPDVLRDIAETVHGAYAEYADKALGYIFAGARASEEVRIQVAIMEKMLAAGQPLGLDDARQFDEATANAAANAATGKLQGAFPPPHDEDMAKLRSDPAKYRRHFDEVFGPGASAIVLGIGEDIAKLVHPDLSVIRSAHGLTAHVNRFAARGLARG